MSKVSRIIVCVGLALVVSATEMMAQRQGFIIGFGIGPGVTAVTNGGDSRVGVGTDLRIGSQVSDQVQVFYANRVVFTGVDNADLVAAGLTGLGVTYVPAGSQLMVGGALGLGVFSVLDVDGGTSSSDTGLGLSGALGYEFAPHWLFDGTLTWSRIDGGFGGSQNIITLRVGFSVLSH